MGRASPAASHCHPNDALIVIPSDALIVIPSEARDLSQPAQRFRYHLRSPAMGSESRCTVRFAGKSSEGKALLETDHLVFRGDFRLSIPRASVRDLQVNDGDLTVEFPDG